MPPQAAPTDAGAEAAPAGAAQAREAEAGATAAAVHPNGAKPATANAKPAAADAKPATADAKAETAETDAELRAAAKPLGRPIKLRRPVEQRSGDQAKRPNTAQTARSHQRTFARTGGKLRRRIIWVAAVFVVLSSAAGTAFALVLLRPTDSSAGQQGAGAQHPTRGGRTGQGPSGLSSAAIVRAQAARWVAREISKSAIIACDEVMCTELFNQGIAASNLLLLGSTAASPLGADVVIGTQVLRHQFGQRLAGEYAPTVIASFGTGKSLVDVRVVAPDGAVAYQQALSRDLAARQRYGGVLLRNSGINVSASAQPDLIAGLVDPRLLMMLPVLAHQHPIRVLGFYDRGPGSAQGVPLSGAELAGYDAAAGLPAGGYLRWLLVFLRGQRAPYWPASVTTALVDGRRVVRVRFSRPSPIGFLNGQ